MAPTPTPTRERARHALKLIGARRRRALARLSAPASVEVAPSPSLVCDALACCGGAAASCACALAHSDFRGGQGGRTPVRSSRRRQLPSRGPAAGRARRCSRVWSAGWKLSRHVYRAGAAACLVPARATGRNDGRRGASHCACVRHRRAAPMQGRHVGARAGLAPAYGGGGRESRPACCCCCATAPPRDGDPSGKRRRTALPCCVPPAQSHARQRHSQSPRRPACFLSTPPHPCTHTPPWSS
jgi:hypothetical protein